MSAHIEVGAHVRGRLSTVERERATAHLASCLECKRKHEELVLAERVLAGDLEVPSAVEHDGLIALVLEKVGAQKPAPPRRFAWLKAAVVLPLATALGAVLLLVVVARPPPEDDAFRARAGRVGDASEREPTSWLRAFCVHGNTPFVLSTNGSCPRTGELIVTVAVTAVDSRAHAFIVTSNVAGNVVGNGVGPPSSSPEEEQGLVPREPGSNDHAVLDLPLPLEAVFGANATLAVVLCPSCTRSEAAAAVRKNDERPPSAWRIERRAFVVGPVPSP